MKNNVFGLAAVAVSMLLLLSPLQAQVSPTLHGHVPPEVALLHLQPAGRMPAGNRMHIAINLPLRNNDALTQFIQDVYNPASPNFRQYLTPEQFTEKYGPTPADYQAVIDFAKSNGLTVTRTHPGRAIVGLDGPVASIERALHVHMYNYQHPTEARQFFAPDVEPSLDLKVPISAISGLSNYKIPHPNVMNAPLPKRAGVVAENGSGTNGNLLGADFRNAYVPGVSLKGAGQTIGLIEYTVDSLGTDGGGYNLAAVQKYESLTGAPNISLVSVLQPNPGGVTGATNSEFSLDLDMIIAMAPGINAINIYLPDNNTTDEEMYQEMASPTKGETRPNQISSSWSNDTSSAASSYFRQMAAQGQSFFYASGDSGAYPNLTGDTGGFLWITMAGGTNLYLNGAGASWQAETVWSGSSGGVLPSLAIPYYQQGVNMSSNQGSTSDRNAPDVASSASGIEIVDSTQPKTGSGQTVQIQTNIGGTSAAAPLWAAFTALVNQQAASQGKPTVGFLNPALYSIGSSASYASEFHDITSGNNENMNSPNAYSAATGYDLCTGWGSPAGASLINALVNLSGPTFVDFNYTGTVQDGNYNSPYSTLAGGVNGVASNGTIFIRTAGSSSETLTITKPMIISASDGAAVIGH